MTVGVAEPEVGSTRVGAGVNLLLVDDEPKNLVALQAILDAPEWNLVSAASGSDALRHLLHEEFAVILLDVQMPGMDGFETAALIREREQTRNTPIIFLTAASRNETFVARGYSVGAVDYILKPLDPEILRTKVAVFVELFRKRQELAQQARQLAEMTAFLNSLLESSTEYAITATDLDGQFLAWNEGARIVYGYSGVEMVGRANVRMLHLPEDLASGRVDALYERALREGKAEDSFDRRRKDGTLVPSSVVVSHLRDAAGKVVGFVAISRDVTEQRRAERQRTRLVEERAARAEAEAARDQLRQVIDALPEGIAVADAELTVLASNAAARDILGGDPSALARPGASSVRILDLGQRPLAPHELPLSRVVAQGATIRGEQLLADRGEDAPPVPILVNGAPLRDRDRAVTGGVLVFQDISAIKDLEREKDSFLAAASHDMKNPLAIIKARAQVLQRRIKRLDAPNTEQLVEGLTAIDQTATKLTGMINELLDHTRIQMGQPVPLDLKSTDLVELVRHVAQSTQSMTDRHRVLVESAAPALEGEWDPLRLDRVLTNLAGNAVKFSPAGGDVVLAIRAEGLDGAAWAVVEVRDSGVGIPERDLPSIFERFYRATNAERRFEGTGLGLFGARRIAEQHGGSLTVTSREGHGSTFTLRLPRTPAAVEAVV
jgi:PAS domain S-box-containing protein